MTPTEHPFQASAAAANGSQPPSQARLALDNLLRRELKVSDPNDAKAVATALLDRYKTNPRALAIQSEAQGLPLQMAQPSTSVLPVAATSSDSEFDQAVTDVNRDLEELTTNVILKDIAPELQGWASAIRSLIQEGINAARFALDVTRRDQAFAMRRSLGDYARMARMIGVLTPAVNVNYRKLAQSLDEVASVLLVKMGEALANVSFNGGRFLLQAPYSELQVRRDAAIINLRNLLNSNQINYGPNDWPRGLDSYRRLYKALEDQGEGDLRGLLNEMELSRSMDVLIQRAAHGNAEGLRALGATAQLDLQRFRRLLAIGQRLEGPESPPLTAFLEALQLFIDAFGDSGGFRLLRVARPPILFYGLYGSGDQGQNAERRLLNIVTLRGALAELLDCNLSCCTGDEKSVARQALLDKILYDIDRAIDLYAMGSQEFGDPEKRAAAYGFLIRSLLVAAGYVYETNSLSKVNDWVPITQAIAKVLASMQVELINRDYSDTSWPTRRDLGSYATDIKKIAEDNKVGATHKDEMDRLDKAISNILQPTNTISSFVDIVDILGTTQAIKKILSDDFRVTMFPGKATYDSISKAALPLRMELCTQLQNEQNWNNLVGSMAPGCIAFKTVHDEIISRLDDTIITVSGEPCTDNDLRIPPTLESTWRAS